MSFNSTELALCLRVSHVGTVIARRGRAVPICSCTVYSLFAVVQLHRCLIEDGRNSISCRGSQRPHTGCICNASTWITEKALDGCRLLYGILGTPLFHYRLRTSPRRERPGSARAALRLRRPSKS